MTNEEAKKRLEVWLKCVYCPEEKKCCDSYLHSTCEYTDYCDAVSIEEAIKVAIKDLEQEPCEDAISRAELLKAIDTWDKFGCDANTRLVPYQDHYVPYIHYDDVIKCIKDMPPVNQFKPICCPSMGIDCEDCPAYEVMEPSTSNPQKPKSECEHDHEILKAYSDGASAVLDKVRAEIDAARFIDKDTKLCKNANASGLEVAMDIIDKFMAEGSDKE